MRDRFESKISKDDGGCWNWTGYRNKKGYGVFKANKEYHGRSFKWGTMPMSKAHRLSYDLHIGPLKDSDVVLHSCDNPSCVNPDHLIKGSQKDNVVDMTVKGRHGSQRFNRDDYLNMSRLRSEGIPVSEISGLYKCSESHVYNVTGIKKPILME